MKNRDEIAAKDKWRLADLFENIDAVKDELKYLKAHSGDLAIFKGKLGEKEQFLEFLQNDNIFAQRMEKVSAYVYLLYSLDISNSEADALQGEISIIEEKCSLAVLYSTNEILSLPDEYIAEILADDRFYEFHNEIKATLKYKPYILPDELQRVVALSGQAISNNSDIFDKAESVDMTFDDAIDSDGVAHPLTIATYGKYARSSDAKLRESAYKNFYAGYRRYYYTISTTFIASLKSSNFITKVHGYESTLQSGLFAGDIDRSIYDSLINNVSANIPKLYEYYDLRKKLLNQSELHFYDLHASIAKNAEQYTFEEALDIVKEAVAPLGENYVNILSTAHENNWIDVYPTKNKDAGAYNMGVYGSHPFVLLNFTGLYNDASTIAHELGHSMHSYYAGQNAYSHCGTSIFTAEIASTLNEVLLLKNQYKKATTTEQKIFYLDSYISMIRSTIFRQTMFSEFEQYAHNLVETEQPISEKILTSKYHDLIDKYFGDSVIHDDDIDIEWTRIPHFYRPFYVYKYATGLISAICMANKILAGADGQLERYINFLKSGSKDYPLVLLKAAGVDLSTSEPFEIAFAELDWAIAELKKCIE